MPAPCDDTERIPVDSLIDAARKNKEIEEDGQRVVKQSLADLIALDRYLALRAAACQSDGNAWGMIGKSRVVPPSAIGEITSQIVDKTTPD